MKMNYNLKKIMRRAWEIKYMDSENIFGLCLKMAWAEEKAAKSRLVNSDNPNAQASVTVSMHYAEYKRIEYLDGVKSVRGSYNAGTKSISVSIDFGYADCYNALFATTDELISMAAAIGNTIDAEAAEAGRAQIKNWYANQWWHCSMAQVEAIVRIVKVNGFLSRTVF